MNKVPQNIVIEAPNVIRPIATDTIANIIATYDSTYNGKYAIATDMNNELVVRGTNGWRATQSTTNMPLSGVGFLIIGGGSVTYSQTGTTVTITHTAHTMTADFNGSDVYLTAGTGALVTGVYTNFTYVGVDTYTCESSVSQSTSGSLGSNTAETFVPITGSSTMMTPLTANIRPGDQLTLGAIRKNRNSANTKTVRMYMFNSLSTSVAPTTSFTFTTIALTATFRNTTQMYDSNISSTLYTISDQSIALSGQLASANDWVWICPVRVAGGWSGGR